MDSFVTPVIFQDVKDFYEMYDMLITCKTSSNCKIDDTDRIALFEVGWRNLQEYVSMEWISNLFITPHRIITFMYTKKNFPKNVQTNKFYQLLYISKENVILGVSKSFQFTDKKNNSVESPFEIINNGIYKLHSNIFENKNSREIADLKKELQNQRQENIILKNKMELLIEMQENESGREDLTILGLLKSNFARQEMEMKELKAEMVEMKKILLENKRPHTNKKDGTIEYLDPIPNFNDYLKF